MTLFVRRSLLVVVLLLLASVGAASAEGAWVLWETARTFPPGTSIETETRTVSIMGARSTERECLDMAQATAQKLAAAERGMDHAQVHVANMAVGSQVSVYWAGPPNPNFTNDSQSKTFLYHCLPDTVDPRGPKGK
jgi:hypothetical protein